MLELLRDQGLTPFPLQRSWVGATGGAAGQISVTTGAGNDSITLTHGTLLEITTSAPVVINGGAGADTISLTGATGTLGLTPTITVAAGQSTTTAYDSITGFDIGAAGTRSATLDFDSVTLTTYSATAPSGSTSAQLTVAVSAAGLVTFAGTSASGLSLAQKIAAVQSVVSTNEGDSALFTHGSNSYVFNNDTDGDSVVELVGVAGTSLVTTNVNTAGVVFIS